MRWSRYGRRDDRFCGKRLRRNHRAHRIDSSIAHPIDELFCIAAVRARHRVRPEYDFKPGSFHGATNNVVIKRHHAFHRGETLFGVTGRAEETLPVGEIILDHETGLRIEVRAVFSHEFQRIVVRQRAVFDLRATGERGRTHGIFVSMDECAYALFVRLVAS